ncbi:MAG: cytochrome c biogenesis protein CcsA [Taibaiella sp.]|nr:cytochrome c biogenesis protein CcsA [Taibaiella sp.]
MSTVEYIGEHLGPGKLGQFFVITSFVAALFSAFTYWRAVQAERTGIGESTWRSMGRYGFIFHTVSVIGIFSVLYYIISSHLFEYHYAWEHSSRALPLKYLFSCFWEGQEGSFMLWTLWHAVLGCIVMGTARRLETRTMTIIAMVQVCLATMILGLYFGPHIRVGSTPFLLLRTTMQGAPVFSMPNYLDFIKDGNGLNVLLQNYWMTIHPPVLFLGFSSTLIPFAFCIAALWKREYTEWVKPALVWALFSGGILGTGIIMGGAWAYESLNFGGYWAWDPVENASLVPWLTLIAGMHTLLVYKATKRSLPATFLLFMFTYCLVWYSTFLTRTGILGKTSVHAFTGDGTALTYHLLIVIGLLLLLCIGLLVTRWKELPRVKSEEETLTREFWMFIGSFILLLSSVQIAITTSIPVWSPLAKWISGKDIAPPVSPLQHYNSIQVWVAIIVGLLSATVLFMKFKHTDGRSVWRRLVTTGVIALALALFIGYEQHINAWQYCLMLFAASYGIVANIYYAIVIQKAKLKKLGPAIAHLGFAMVLMGILLSSFNKHIISQNTLGVLMDMGKGSDAANARESADNIMLFINTPVAMQDYVITYRGDSSSAKDPRIFYRVDYVRADSATHNVLEAFTMYPDAFVNVKGQVGITPTPATKHYWNKDIFTYVTSVMDPSKKTDTSKYESHLVHKGDTIFINNGYIVFNGFNTQVSDPRYKPQTGDIAVAALLSVYDMKGPGQEMHPIYYIRSQYENTIDDTLRNRGLYTRLSKIIPAQNAAEIQIKQTDPKDNYIVLKALVFPFINVLWIGVIVMVLGFFISIWSLLSKKSIITRRETL